MKAAENILEISKRINALAETGLTYAESMYDTERYEELRKLSREIMSELTGQPLTVIESFFMNECEYKTPKVDIRAVVFDNQERLLLVREKVDGLWSLPGGWADVGFSPSETAVKEVYEETGLLVKPKRLMAVFDKKYHPHPPHLNYVYKIFIGCKYLGGELRTSFDTLDAGFFAENCIPALSRERVTPGQISMMFEYHRDPYIPPVFD